MPTLYLMLGYPGAGKTTAAHAIHDVTGAVHLWADQIRRERFGVPKYTHEENLGLYEHLNELAAELLATGQSVVYDTNFNFYKDRQRLKSIADKHRAKTHVIWLTTPKTTAKNRAIKDAHLSHTRVLGDMLEHDFERLSGHLQTPREDEEVIKLDGTKITKEYIKTALGL